MTKPKLIKRTRRNNTHNRLHRKGKRDSFDREKYGQIPLVKHVITFVHITKYLPPPHRGLDTANESACPLRRYETIQPCHQSPTVLSCKKNPTIHANHQPCNLGNTGTARDGGFLTTWPHQKAETICR